MLKFEKPTNEDLERKITGVALPAEEVMPNFETFEASMTREKLKQSVASELAAIGIKRLPKNLAQANQIEARTKAHRTGPRRNRKRDRSKDLQAFSSKS